MRKSEIVLFTEDDSNTLFCIVDRGKSGMVGCLHNLFKEVFEAFSLTTRNEGTCLSSLLPRPPVPFRKPGNMFVRITISLLAIWALGFLERSPVFASSTPTQADHVLLFVLEGVGNDAIQNGTMPVLQKLAQEGAVTWNAQSVSPPFTVPAMASLLTGLPVKKHRVNQEWEIYDFSRSFLRSPTLFDYLDLAGGVDTSLFIMDERFYQLARPEIYVDLQTCGKAKPQCNPATQVEYIKDYLKKVTSAGGYNFRIFEIPGLLVAHLPEPADVAHKRGWDSGQYQVALQTVDTAIADVMAIYQEYGVLDKTMVMVAGLQGPGSPPALNAKMAAGAHQPSPVPWFAWGANVKSGYTISEHVSIMDIGATVLAALGLETHTEWESRALTDIFQKRPERRTTGNETFELKSSTIRQK